MLNIIKEKWNKFSNSLASWGETIRENNNVIKKEGFLGKGRSDYNWYPSNYNRETGELYHSEDYKNLFLKLRFNGHIHDNSYFKVLKRFEEKYKQDKNLREKIARYLEITEENYTFPKKNSTNTKWKNPLNDIKGIGPLGIIPIVVDTELGKEYKKLEFELKEIFNKI